MRYVGIGDGRVSVSVSEATEKDVVAFDDFFRRAWKEAGPGAPGFTGASDEVIAELTTPEAFRERIGGPDRRMFLAWDGNRVIAFASTRGISEDAVELSGIIVLRSHGGMGVGTALVESAIAAAEADRHRMMLVKTEATNRRAQAFYENRGFSVVGTETERVDDVEIDLLCLSRVV